VDLGTAQPLKRDSDSGPVSPAPKIETAASRHSERSEESLFDFNLFEVESADGMIYCITEV
jgi:hypothetical protein